MMEELSSSKCRFLQELHGVTSEKTPFFIVTAVKTSNLTRLWLYSVPSQWSRDRSLGIDRLQTMPCAGWLRCPHRALSPVVKRREREATHTPVSSGEIKDGGFIFLFPIASWGGA
jgi:hypothetical protein